MFLKTLFILLSVYQISNAQDVLCTEKFCEKYLKDSSCPTLPKECNIQNATHNGLVLPYTGPCNCCDYCLKNLKEGDDCAIGGITSIVPNNICGPGLACKETTSDKKSVCKRMESSCFNAQEQYDIDRKNGALGHMQLRPNCNGNGEYEPYVCIPGEICYCVDEENNRIFGEIPFTSVPAIRLHCKCSRAHNAASKSIGKYLLPSEHLRCQSNGDYDKIQCIGQMCLCVDADDAKPTYPKLEMANMTAISNKTLPCFDNKTHLESYYYRDCEEKFMKLYEELMNYEKEGLEVLPPIYPNCQLDGYYAPVQSTDTHKYCSDLHGTILENFSVEIDSPKAKNMNCKCARARTLISQTEKPTCCENGNYNKVQCRRGLCRCVDENGNQIEKEVSETNVQQLSCFKNAC